MGRLPDWPDRLGAYIATHAHMRFAWGNYAHDCCSFAFGAATAITGRDLMDGLPTYASAEEADLLLAKPIEAWLDELLPRVEPAMAQRGDIAVADVREETAALIVEG